MINLYEYQKQYLADFPKRGIMAADTGTGKTFMALEHYRKFNLGGAYRGKWVFKQPLLILAPASKIRTKDWEREIDEYFGDNKPEYQIYSFEKFSRTPSLKQFAKGEQAIWKQFVDKKVAIIVDECHRVKNPQSNIGKAVFAVSKGAQFFVGLSATPLPNGWIDFANYSKIWGFTNNITEFKKKYCDIVTFKGFPEIRGYLNEEELTAQWQSISKRLTKAEALDLPERTFVGVDFERPAIYNKIFKTRVNEDGELLDTAPALAHCLRQTLTKPKLDYLADLIEGTEENIVIFYNYVSEREAILETLKKKHSERRIFRQDGEKHELPKKADWPNVKKTITLAQYQSGSTGVEMTYATQVIYFSPTYSYSDYDQSLGRTYRNGQKSKTTVHNFRTPNTIEQAMYECLKHKQNFQVEIWVENNN